MSNITVDKEQLKADIEALKNTKNKAEVDAILAKYNDALEQKEQEEKAAKAAKKKGPVKVDAPKRGEKKKAEPKKETAKKEPAKKEAAKKDTEKKEPAKKTPAKKTATKAAATKAATPKKTEEKKSTGRQYNGKYEVYQVGDGFRYNLKASNGEVLVASEVYASRDGVIKAIEAVQRNIETGEVRVFVDKHGRSKFKLTARNHRVIALSASYSTEKSAERASESFKKFAVKADIVDIEVEDNDAAEDTVIEINKEEDKEGGKFTIESFNGEFSWDLKASNGQILCQAEGYTSKSGVLASIETFKKNVRLGNFKCTKDKNEHYHYKLYSENGRVSAIGEAYTTKQSAESAANSVVSFIEKAEIEEIEAKNE